MDEERKDAAVEQPSVPRGNEQSTPPAGEEAPDYSEIAEALNRMGANLKAAFETAFKDQRSQEVRRGAEDAFDKFMKKTDQVVQDAKSGALEKTARKAIFQTIDDLNRLLTDFAKSAKAEEPGGAEAPDGPHQPGQPEKQ